MRLVVIRHADAEAGEDDAARPLSERGWAQGRQLSRALRALGLRFERLHHSPKRRAVETAECVARLADTVVVTPGLAAAPDRALVAEITGESVAVVGHQPDLGKLVDLLVGTKAGSAIDWKKGGVVWLEGTDGGWDVVAVLPPRVLKRIGG